MTSADAPTGAAKEPCGNLRDLPIVLWEVDSRGSIVRLDGNEKLLTGTSFAALRGANVLEVFAHTIPDLRTNFDLAMEGRNPHMTATVFGRTWALHSSPRGEGAEERLIGVAYDMTDTLRTEAALETALAHLRRFESIVEEGPAIVFAWRVEAEAPVEHVSQNVAQTGYTAHEFLLGSVTWSDIVEPADLPRVEREVAAYLADGTDAFRCCYRIRRRDGEERWLEEHSRIVRDRAGRASRVQGIAIDVTERVRADQEVKASREQLRQLTCRVEAAREAERSRLSREIHDRVGQMLALLRMQVSDWRQRAATDGSPPAPEDLATMDARLTDAIETVRHIAAELRPQVLDDLGLAAAVTWQARHFNETGPVRFACEVDIAAGEWPPGAATDFFRIFQEASVNALQHAHARQVVVRLRRTRREFVMEVEDDGRGIPHGKAHSPDSLGLLGMRERAARAGGRVTIRRRVNATGTIVRATCPIPTKGS